MRALTIDAHGGLDQLRLRDDLPTPPLVAPDDVRVRVRAAALNHLDLWTVAGVPGVHITAPWILGADGTGVIDAVGDAVRDLRPGVPVILNPGVSCGRCEYCRSHREPLCLGFAILGEHRAGTLADFIVLPARNVRAIPPEVPLEIAAAYPLVTLTAWRMCTTRAAVGAGEEVLIWGIGGGVAQAALRVCTARGAHTWVTSGSDDKLERARAIGADETLRHGPGTDIGREIRARTGKRGVDVVVDSVGAATWSQSLGALGRGGRLVTCGGTSGPMVETDVRRLFWNQWSILGSTMGSQREFDEITAALIDGRLSVTVDSVHPLADAPAAFARLAAARQFGKIVVRIS